HKAPAVVQPARRPGRGEVHLFPAALAIVSNIEIPQQGIKSKAPGIAQPFGPDGAQGWASSGPGIIRRDGIQRRCGWGLKTWSEAQQLAQQGIVTLGVVGRIPAAPPIAHADIEIALAGWAFLRAEEDETTVVVDKGLQDQQHSEGAAGVGLLGIVTRD